MDLSVILNKVGFFLKKNSPEIATYGGIALLLGGVVAGCIASTKVKDVTEKNKQIIEEARNNSTEENKGRNLTKAYATAAWNYTKLYGPTVLLAAGGSASLVYSNREMGRRNAAAMATASIATDALERYKKKVKELEGEERATEIDESIKEDIAKEEKKEKHVQGTKRELTGYHYMFDCLNDNWQEDGCRNYTFLINVQNAMHHKLITQGFLFLNDVLRALGDEKGIKDGQYIGWIYDPSNKGFNNCISFGLYDPFNVNGPASRKIYRDEPDYMLYFNCDGYILNYVYGGEDAKAKAISNTINEKPALEGI